MKQVTVTITGTIREITLALHALENAKGINQDEPACEGSEVKAEPEKRKRRTKAEMEAEAKVEAPEPEEEVDLGEVEEKKLSLENDVIPAFQKYAKKYDRAKAGAVLAKFGVRSVRDLPADKYAAVLEVLGV